MQTPTSNTVLFGELEAGKTFWHNSAHHEKSSDPAGMAMVLGTGDMVTIGAAQPVTPSALKAVFA